MSMDELLDKVTTDPAFADQLRQHPEQVLRSIDVEPTDELVETITTTTGSEDLAARISKRFRFGG